MAPGLWIAAFVATLLSAAIAGYFARSNARDSDERKAKAERERIDKDAVRDAATAFASTCQESQLIAARFRHGILPDTPEDQDAALSFRLNTALTLANQISAARFNLEVIAPRGILEAMWPLYSSTSDHVQGSFVLQQDEDSGVFTKRLGDFITSVRHYLDKEEVTYSEVATILGRLRHEELRLRREKENRQRERETRTPRE